MQIAARLKTRSPAPVAGTRLDIAKPTAPTDVTIAAIIGKNIAFRPRDPHQLAHLTSSLLILVNQAGASMFAVTATAGVRVYSAGASVGCLAAGFGAPMRNLLSNSDNAPPHIITTAPNQMSSTIGL
jgi:hypothetical protein